MNISDTVNSPEFKNDYIRFDDPAFTKLVNEGLEMINEEANKPHVCAYQFGKYLVRGTNREEVFKAYIKLIEEQYGDITGRFTQ